MTKLHDEANEWLSLYVRRIPRDTFKCFENRKWTQVENFNRFQLRCRGSWHMAAVFVETLLCKLLLGAGASAWEVSAMTATLQAARDAGLVSGGRQTTEWIEEIVALCNDQSVANAVPLSYNYDLRVEADYSASALRTKAEWRREEFVVPAAEKVWLRGRATLVLLLEAQVKGDTTAACGLSAQLLSMWTQTGVLAEGGSDRLASWRCYRVTAALLSALPTLVAVHGVPTAPTLAAALSAVGAAVDAVAQLQAHMASGGFLATGWASDVSYAAFQLLPLAAVQLRVWRSLLPSKGVRNRMDAECKVLISDLTARIRALVEGLHALGDQLNKSCTAGIPAPANLTPDGNQLLGDRAPPLEPVYGKLEQSWSELAKFVRQAVTHAQAGIK